MVCLVVGLEMVGYATTLRAPLTDLVCMHTAPFSSIPIETMHAHCAPHWSEQTKWLSFLLQLLANFY